MSRLRSPGRMRRMGIMVGGSLAGLLVQATAIADPKLINAETLSALQIPIVFSAPAETVSLQRTRISSEIEARVMDMPARTADIIEAGTTLVKLDCRDYELTLRRTEAEFKAAQAQLQLAKQRLDRTIPLIDRKHISQDLVDQRNSEVDAAGAMLESRQAQIDQARANVSRCVIKSPFRAAVIARHAGIGEFARTGTVLLDIQDLDRVEVSAQVVPTDVPSLTHTPEVFLEFSGKRFPLVVSRVNPVIEEATRTQEARLVFANESAPVGASGRLIWTDTHPGLPADLLVQRGGKLGVFTVENNSAKFLPLKNAVEGRPAVVEISGDTLIVTIGRHNLSTGDAVKLEN